MNDLMDAMKFLPFKSYASNSKVKITRKRLELDLSVGEFYPGEGHRSLFKYNDNDSSCIIIVIGGSRQGEDSNPLSNRLMQIKLVSTFDDVYINSTEPLKTRGSILPSLCSPGFTWGINNSEMCIWGGLLIDTYQTNDEFFYIKPKLVRQSFLFDIVMYSGSKDFSFESLDHISVKKEILYQRETPKARAGHSLTNIPKSSKLVMFGGYSLPNREIQSAASANPFVQMSEDDNFYVLDIPSVTWKWLELPGCGPRCFHTADFISEKQMAIVGGLVYKGYRPVERLSLNSITVLNVIDISKMEFSLSNYMFDIEPTYISYHGSVMFKSSLLVYGGYSQHEPQIPESTSTTQNLNGVMFVFDFNTQNASKVSSPKENAVAGNSLIVADDATVLIMGGTIRNYCVFTSKPFTPSPCGLNPKCIIQDSPEVSPIQWIQCDGSCQEWHHLFCTGLKCPPKGNYYCTACSAKTSKRK